MLYDRKRQGNGWDYGDKFYYGIRTPEPYTAKHLPWYFDLESINNEEERWYQSNSDKLWTTVYRNEYKINLNGLKFKAKDIYKNIIKTHFSPEMEAKANIKGFF